MGSNDSAAPANPKITVTVTPDPASLSAGDTTIFHAKVNGVAAPVVTWSVREGTTGGTITNTGVYSAPGSPGTFTVEASVQQAGAARAIRTATVNVTSLPPPGSPQAFHATASAACASMPLRPASTGRTWYFCDCQAGADANCKAGKDTNPGTETEPMQTVAAANTLFSSLAAGDTIAFCKGGAWNTGGLRWANANCRAGADLADAANPSTCDLRDYAPSWGGTAKPIINVTSAISRNSTPVPSRASGS